MTFHGFTSRAVVGFGTVAVSALSFAANANAAGDPRGIWYDHNGRGAVEIKECAANASRLCGHVVYVKKARNKKRCGMQIIGNVRSNGRGWIYSPSRGRSFPLAVKRLSNNRLRIVGNAGSFFTKTYIWKRAPDTIANCGQPVVAKAKAEAAAKPVAAAPKPVAPRAAPTPKPRKTSLETTDTKFTNSSSATAALLATPAVAAAPAPAPTTTPAASAEAAQAPAAATPSTATATPAPAADAPVTADANENGVDDLTPPGGLSNGGDDKLGKLNDVIKKFTGGKGLKGLKVSGKGSGKCKYRIPYVGRTINVPCR